MDANGVVGMPANRDELTFAGLLDSIAEATPAATCLVDRGVRVSFAEFRERTFRFASVLSGAGLGLETSRTELSGWQSGQAHVALLLRNGSEYLEAMLGACVARAASFNVNYRYTVDELADLFRDARPRVVVVHDEFAGTARAALDRVGGVDLLLQVADDSGLALVDGAVRWSQALASAEPSAPRRDWSPDDLYVLYTGGTTGTPKGVLWRQADAMVSAIGVQRRDGSEFSSIDEVIAVAVARRHRRIVLPAPPFAHGAAQWFALGALLAGGQVVIPGTDGAFAPPSVLDAIEQHDVSELMLVGDAFGRPLAAELESRPRRLPSLRALVNGGAALSPTVRDRLLEAIPGVRIVDSVGSSESGRQTARSFDVQGAAVEQRALPGTVVVSEDRTRVLAAGEVEVGWLARSGRIPLGYLADQHKTEQTFPTLGGVRHVVPGDRARIRTDGSIEVLGRDSSTINTGGEKVHGEEVEEVLTRHPAISDAIVIGRPSVMWGQEVVAVISTSRSIEPDEVVRHAGQWLARYKLPKQVLVVDQVPRTISGKPDYRATHLLVDAAEVAP